MDKFGKLNLTPTTAIARLAAMGLPADRLEDAAALLDAVVATALIGEDDRKARDRDRKARKAAEIRGRDRNSAEVPGTERNGAEQSGTKNAVDINTNTTRIENNLSSQQQRSRGTRLPDDFQPLPNILELARRLGFTDAEYWDHLQRFCDYWRSLSGAKATKLDWQATWRNRVKDLADRLRKTPNGKNTGNSLAARFDAIRASIEGGGKQGDAGGPEDSFGLPRLRQGA